MEYVLYTYVPSIGQEEIKTFLTHFESMGFELTHLGKRDNPKKWSGDMSTAIKIILEGNDSTNYSFFRDAKNRIDGDIQIRNDPRWGYDTISVSYTKQDALRSFGKDLALRLEHYIVFDGTMGKGKEQVFNIISISEACPSIVKGRIKTAEQKH
jgi:hypothetical protein